MKEPTKIPKGWKWAKRGNVRRGDILEFDDGSLEWATLIIGSNIACYKHIKVYRRPRA